jgi:2-oxoglutarate ferredoxin oxidoreductase subunit beta
LPRASPHKGFSFIEVVSACPISFGRQNKMGGPAKMLEWQRDHGVMKAAWDKMTAEQRAGKFPIGVLYETTIPRNTPKLMTN